MLLAELVWAAEHRRVELASGRVLVAEIAATRPDGLDLRTPQGIIAIRFDEVHRIDPIEAALYTEQPPMRVLQLSSGDAAFDTALHEQLLLLPVSRVQRWDQATGQSANVLPALVACAHEVRCVETAARTLDVDVVFFAVGEGDDRWVRAAFPGAKDANGGRPARALNVDIADLLRLADPLPSPTPPIPADTKRPNKAAPTRTSPGSSSPPTNRI